jgi:hypothetical protein
MVRAAPSASAAPLPPPPPSPFGRKIRLLDLCSGTQSVGAAARRIFGAANVAYTSVDFDASSEPDIVADLRTWDYRAALRPGSVDVVWGSPPCTEYSIARNRSKRPRDFKTADAIAKRVMEIIEYLRPARWYVENPATGHLKRKPFMRRWLAYRQSTSYCKYGFKYRKQTNIWTNAPVQLASCLESPCAYKKATGVHSAIAQHGPNSGTTDPERRDSVTWARNTGELYRIPYQLVKKLFSA